MEGKAERLDDVPLELVKRYCKKAGKPEPESADSEKISPEHAWYRLTPSKMVLIHNKHFGWERRDVL